MLLQITLTILLTLTSTNATPPPGYKAKPQEPDAHPPKYEYGYNIADEEGRGQGKMETRDGIYALGRYYVQGAASSQSVEYLADDWGYHPYVEYSSVGPHSRTITQFALGKEAVKAFRNNNKDIFDSNFPLAESIKKLNEPETETKNQVAGTSNDRTQPISQPQPAHTRQPVFPSQFHQPTSQTQADDLILIPQPTQQTIPVNVVLLPQQATEQRPQVQPLQNLSEDLVLLGPAKSQPRQQLVLVQNGGFVLGGNQNGGVQNFKEDGNIEQDRLQQQQQLELGSEEANDSANVNGEHQSTDSSQFEQPREQILLQENVNNLQQTHEDSGLNVEQEQGTILGQEKKQGSGKDELRIQHLSVVPENQFIQQNAEQNRNQQVELQLSQHKEQESGNDDLRIQHLNVAPENQFIEKNAEQNHNNLVELQLSQHKEQESGNDDLTIQQVGLVAENQLIQKDSDQNRNHLVELRNEDNLQAYQRNQETLVQQEQAQQEARVQAENREQIQTTQQREDTQETYVPVNFEIQHVNDVTEPQLLDNEQGQKSFQSVDYQQLVNNENLQLQQQDVTEQQISQDDTQPSVQEGYVTSGDESVNIKEQEAQQQETVNALNRRTKVLQATSNENLGHNELLENAPNTVLIQKHHSEIDQHDVEQQNGNVNVQQQYYNTPVVAPIALPLVYRNQITEQSYNFGNAATDSNSQELYNTRPQSIQIDEGNVLKNILLTQKSAYYRQPQVDYSAVRGETSTERLNTAALYESGANKYGNDYGRTVYDDVYNIETVGGYGSKINAKLNTQLLPETNYRHTFRNRPTTLIENTKNLVNGLDVLSINEAADENYENVESSTAKLVTSSVEDDLPPQDVQVETVKETVSNSQESNYETHSEISSTTAAPIIVVTKTEPTPYALSLQHNPIIVRDYEDNTVKSSQNFEVNDEKKEYFSTTQNTIEIVDSNRNYQTTEATIVVTPRPVATNYLVPIHAGVQLQNAEEKSQAEAAKLKQNFLVEIQESVPFYVGKYEYLQNPSQLIKKQEGDKKISSTYSHQNVINDLELGQSLLDFPLLNDTSKSNENIYKSVSDQQQVQGQVQHIKKLPPILLDGKEKIINHLDLPYEITNANYYQYHLPPTEEVSHEIPHQIQNIVNIEPEQKIVPQPYPVEKIVEKQIHVPVHITRYVDRPYPVHVPVAQHVPYPVEKIVEKYINRPYPVQVPVRVPVQVPVHVEKQVPVPYPVEKIVEKPVIRVVERPVPQPYPVDRIVEKTVQVPVEVTKYVDRQVNVPVAQPVPYPVEVEKIVEKIVNQPYPVEVRVPVQVPVQVPVPHPIPVERIVEKKVPVHVQVPVPVAQAYVVPVEVPSPYPIHVTKYVPQPYPVQVTQTIKVPVPTPVAVRVPHPVPVEVPKYIDRPYPIYVEKESKKHYQYYYYPNPYSYAPDYQPSTTNTQPIVAYGVPSYSVSSLQQNKAQVNYQPIQTTHASFIQYGVPITQESLNKYSNYQTVQKPYVEYGAPNTDNVKTVNQNEYIGLVPPKEPRRAIGGYRKNRQTRHSFEHNPKLEYGFMPPLIPSLEIDENGNPVEREES